MRNTKPIRRKMKKGKKKTQLWANKTGPIYVCLHSLGLFLIWKYPFPCHAIWKSTEFESNSIHLQMFSFTKFLISIHSFLLHNMLKRNLLSQSHWNFRRWFSSSRNSNFPSHISHSRTFFFSLTLFLSLCFSRIQQQSSTHNFFSFVRFSVLLNGQKKIII